jgi:crotonobetainyl-CoA:carnitine CoA-transferase CaiB-like acyl-CoA transferase
VFVATVDDAMWQRLCRAIGHRDAAGDADLASAAGRRSRADHVERILEAWTSRRSADEAMHHLQQFGVAAGVARNPCDLSADPHLMARGFWQPVRHPVHGPHLLPSLAFRDSDTPIPLRHPAQTIGESNTAVLGGLLGLTDAALAELTERRIIGTARLRD